MKKTIYLILLLMLSNAYENYCQDKPKRELGQPVIMALPGSKDGKDPLTMFKEDPVIQAAATAINQVLTERKMEVRDLKQQIANFDRLRAKMSSLQGDPNAMIAANTGADVYLEFSLELIREGPGKKARVDITVKETATAKLLGAGTGTSSAMVTSDISSLAQIAVNNCIDRIMEQIRGYWADVPKTGKPVIFTMTSKSEALNRPTASGKRIDRELTAIMKENTISYRREMSTGKTIMFNPVYVDIYKFDDVEEFSYKIQDLLQTFGLTCNPQIEGKSIEIEID